MTAKQYLSQAIQLDRRIRAKRANIKHLRELACSVSPAAGEYAGKSGAGDPVGRSAARIADLEAELRADVKRYTALHREIAAVIDRVPDARYVELLTRRYICGQTWEQIAEGMSYNSRWVRRLHGKALYAVSLILQTGP